VLDFAPEGGCAGFVVVVEDGADTAFWQLGRSFFSVPRVSLVYFISPFGPTVPGWPTRHVELSDVSRVLQLSIRICPPGQFSVTLSGILCADAPSATHITAVVANRKERNEVFIDEPLRPTILLPLVRSRWTSAVKTFLGRFQEARADFGGTCAYWRPARGLN